jgi:hypothetical protein
LGLEFCDVSALQAQNKITGQSRQILFEGLPPQTQDLHGFFRALASDFVVLVLSDAVLSETVLVLNGCLNCGDADR